MKRIDEKEKVEHNVGHDEFKEEDFNGVFMTKEQVKRLIHQKFERAKVYHSQYRKVFYID